MRITTLVSAFALTVLVSGAAFALDAAPAADPSTATKPATAGSKSAISAECSKQADAKNLHGAKRKQFREQCKKDGEKQATQ